MNTNQEGAAAPPPPPNGADVVVTVASLAGITACFANPGTTELTLLGALDRHPEIRCVLGLFEGVCTGAADGHARMTGRPSLSLLHMGPGLANGLANLHNANKARSPVVTIVGDHASWHSAPGAPLTSDIAALARPVSRFVQTVRDVARAGVDTADTFRRSMELAGPATLILSADVMWSAAPGALPTEAAVRDVVRPTATPDVVAAAARALRSGRGALVLGGAASHREGLRLAARIARASGCDLLSPTAIARLDRGPDLPVPERIPHPPELATRQLAVYASAVLVGVDEPVSPFATPGGATRLFGPKAEIVSLGDASFDLLTALEALLAALEADGTAPRPERPELRAERPAIPTGRLNPGALCTAIALAQPEGAIVIDEGGMSSGLYFKAASAAPSFTYLSLTGGAIGQALPCAVGASIASPGSRVIVIVGDGSALYTIQALWTLQREKLPVTVVVAKNREYLILKKELQRLRIVPGPASRALTDLTDPDIDFVGLARSFGVEGRAAVTAESFAEALAYGMATPHPLLIEACLQ